MRAAVRASACAGCRGQRLAGLTLSPVQFANRRGRRGVRAGAKYQVYRSFFWQPTWRPGRNRIDHRQGNAGDCRTSGEI